MSGDLLSTATSIASGAQATDVIGSAIDSAIPRWLPGGVSERARDLLEENSSGINGFFAPFMEFFSKIGTWLLGVFDWILGMIDPNRVPQKPLLEASMAKIDARDGQFDQIATSLGLSAEFGETLEADVKSAARSAFGMTGLNGETASTTQSITDLQATLTQHIYAALIAKDGRLSEAEGTQRAARAASAITGLNLNGPTDNLATRFADPAARPTAGFGAMLFAMEDQIRTRAPSINVPDLTFVTAPLATPAAAPAPATAR
jgi:hypothetical protein